MTWLLKTLYGGGKRCVHMIYYLHVHVLVLGDCLTFRPKDCLQPREMWF